jgi:hypothetical protein
MPPRQDTRDHPARIAQARNHLLADDRLGTATAGAGSTLLDHDPIAVDIRQPSWTAAPALQPVPARTADALGRRWYAGRRYTSSLRRADLPLGLRGLLL